MLEKTKMVLELISKDELFQNNDIRFVGGTALSYRIDHRLSEDLDFATSLIDKDAINKMVRKYSGRSIEHHVSMIDSALNDGEDISNSYLIFIINDVKVEFFTPPFNIGEEKEIWDKDQFTYYENTHLKVASLETLIYMKSMAFWNRKKYRDLFDIWYLLNNKMQTVKEFLEKYISFHFTYDKEQLLEKIKNTKTFYFKSTDEGISTLVKNHKPYEWYRNEIESMIQDAIIEELYKS